MKENFAGWCGSRNDLELALLFLGVLLVAALALDRRVEVLERRLELGDDLYLIISLSVCLSVCLSICLSLYVSLRIEPCWRG